MPPSFASASKVSDLESRLKQIEQHFNEFAFNTNQAVQSVLKKNWMVAFESQALYGIHIGLCVSTLDPLAMGRVQYYLAGTTNKNTPVERLPWAYPISVLGGFDDSGAPWVPPAGSAIVILFEHGDRESAYYMGTVWNRDRGNDKDKTRVYLGPEYDQIHKGHRGGYLVGPNDESQVLPPSNTENYNIKDFDDTQGFDTNPDAFKGITPAHIHMMKTPQKHRIKMDDGNYYCHQRWKRLEIGSSCGHTFLMYDDHMHPAGQWVNPKCNSSSSSSSANSDGIPCGKDGLPDSSNQSCGSYSGKVGENRLFKHASECRAFTGPGTPQNNKCELKQTGIFLSSISGHIFVMDDEVSTPRGSPEWEKSTQPFDFGCDNKFNGNTFWKSATGHIIKMGDSEDAKAIRTSGERLNGIQLLTATGHLLEMTDDTITGKKAGPNRQIRLISTSNHSLVMNDNGNDQASPDRKEGGEPTAKATNAFIQLKSGYGLSLLMRDDNSQQSTQNQFIELMAPQKDNKDKGPHILAMYEKPAPNPGIVFLRAGGIFYGNSVNEWIEVVGNDANPSSKIVDITKHYIQQVKNTSLQLSENEYHFAKQLIVLGAGQDCLNPDKTKGPCLYPVIVAQPPFFRCPLTGFTHMGLDQASNRVFGSSGPKT